MTVTIRQIAEACGLSQPTVSRILNRRGAAHSRQTVKRVFDTAGKLGYVPNSFARGLARGRFSSVGLVLGIRDYYSHAPAGLLAGIGERLTEHGTSLMVSYLPDSDTRDRDRLPDVLRGLQVDGLLVNYTQEVPAPMVDTMNRLSIPSVWLNTKRRSNCARPDDAAAAAAAASHLIALGHSRIAYEDHGYNDANRHYSHVDRYEGYRTVMKRAGLPPRMVTYGEERRSQEDTWRRLLSSADRPTAVISYGSGEVPVSLAARSLGLRIPDDISVITFADRPVEVGVEVTTMVVPWHALGRAGVDLLYRRIDTKRAQPPELVPFGEPVGQTCTCPPHEE